jgi:hypothetical protein
MVRHRGSREFGGSQRGPWAGALGRFGRFAGPPNGAQQVQRFGQGKLLAAECGDEAAAADFAAGFQAAQHYQEIAPRGGYRLASGRIAE